MKRYHLMLGACLAVIVVGCGDGSHVSPSGGGQQQGPTTNTVDSVGGTVTDASRKTQLVFQAGSVAQATKVDIAPISQTPPSDAIVPGTAFRFGPNGTAFPHPVMLTVSYDPIKIPAGGREKDLAVFQIVGGKYEKVPFSSVDASTHSVSTWLDHFSDYAVLAQNPFSGHYTGTYTEDGQADLGGDWAMDVSETGQIRVQVADTTGSGHIALTGDATATASGGGAVKDATYSFSGQFSFSAQAINVSGTWSARDSKQTYQGRWSGSGQPVAITINTNVPNDRTYRITPEPAMPHISAEAVVNNLPDGVAAPTQFEWRLAIVLKVGPEKINIGRTIAYNPGVVKGGANFVPDFMKTIRGGDLILSARCMVNGVWLEGEESVKIVGDNPSTGQVLGGLDDVLKRIALTESNLGGLRQFDSHGLPLWSSEGAGGVGLFQITPPRDKNSGNYIPPPPTDDQVWDWRTNLKGAGDILEAKENESRNYPGGIQDALDSGKGGWIPLKRAGNVLVGRTADAPVAVPEWSDLPRNVARGLVGEAARKALGMVQVDAIRGYNGYGVGQDAGGGPHLHEFRPQLTTDKSGMKALVLKENKTLKRWEIVWEDTPEAERKLKNPNTWDYVSKVLNKKP